jgi:hypothetical protein
MPQNGVHPYVRLLEAVRPQCEVWDDVSNWLCLCMIYISEDFCISCVPDLLGYD